MNTRTVQELQSIINKIPGMVFICSFDRDFTFEYVSEGVTELLGYRPSDLVHINAFRKLVHPEDQLRNDVILSKINPQNTRYEMIYRMRTIHGVDKWVKEQGLAVYSENGELSFIQGLLTDVTDQKIAEMELLAENRLLRAARSDRYRLGRLIGKSDVMQSVYDVILKAAANKDVSALVVGESGTGKELVARAIHDLSERGLGPFVAVNCGAIPEYLFESEFFGYRKGAFTGASSDKKGFLETADGGTLFLDEVGEIPPSLQVKLLRALEEKSFTPVGSPIPKSSDFRIVAATNRDVSTLVNQGDMRLDFFFRINVIPIRIPALRERREDIPLLVEYFLERFGSDTDKVNLPFELLGRLRAHNWPGNIRELKNAVERFVTMGELSFLEMFDPYGGPEKKSSTPHIDEPLPSAGLNEALMDYERRLILQALKECRWKKGDSAQRLGISWRTLQRKLKKYATDVAD